MLILPPPSDGEASAVAAKLSGRAAPESVTRMLQKSECEARRGEEGGMRKEVCYKEGIRLFGLVREKAGLQQCPGATSRTCAQARCRAWWCVGSARAG